MKHRVTVFIQSGKRDRENASPFVTLALSYTCYKVEHVGLCLQVGNLRFAVTENNVGSPCKVFRLDIACRERSLKTVRFHGCKVGITANTATAYTLCKYRTDKVEVITLVVRQLHVDTVVQETEVGADVPLMFLFIRQVFVLHLHDLQTRFRCIGIRTPRRIAVDVYKRVGNPCRTCIRRQTVRCFQRKVRKRRLQGFEERFFVHVPRTTHVPCRKPASRTSLTQTVRAFVTERTGDAVTPFIRVSTCGEVSQCSFFRIVQREIIGIVFLHLLERIVAEERNFTFIVYHTPTVETVVRTVLRVGLHTAVQVDDVVAVDNCVIRSRGAEVPAEHPIVSNIIETSFRQYAECQRV